MADEPTGQAPDTTQDADGQEPDADANATPPWGDDKDFDPKRAMELISDLREEVKGLKADKSAAKEAADEAQRQARAAEEAKLAENEQYKELADTRANRLLELEPLEPKVKELEAERDQYRDALQRHVDATMKDIPAHVKELLAGRSPIEALEWLSKHGESFRKAGAAGVPDSPSPNGDHKLSAEALRKEGVAAAERLVRDAF